MKKARSATQSGFVKYLGTRRYRVNTVKMSEGMQVLIPICTLRSKNIDQRSFKYRSKCLEAAPKCSFMINPCSLDVCMHNPLIANEAASTHLSAKFKPLCTLCPAQNSSGCLAFSWEVL